MNFLSVFFEKTVVGRVDEGSYLPPSPTDPDVRN
jgi:hypothetical protein